MPTLTLALATLGLATSPAPVERFGLALAVLDVDGDGRPELIVSDGQESPERLLVLTLAGEVLAEIPAGSGESGFGSILAPAGDLNGDGNRELWVVVQRVEGGESALVALDLKQRRRLHTVPLPSDRWLIEWDSVRPGPILVPSPDLDGDGVEDLLVGTMNEDEVGTVRVISGAEARVLRTVAGPPTGAGFGVSLTPLADLNGDGVPDWAAGALPALNDENDSAETRRTGRVRVHSGADGSLILDVAPEAAGPWFGCGVHAHPDRDGDELEDLLVTEPPHRGKGGGLWLVSSANGEVLRRWGAHGVERSFGARTLVFPDVDGGGEAEILVTVPTTFDPTSRILLLRGEADELLWKHEASVMEDTYLGVSALPVGDLDGDAVPDVAVGGCAIRSGIPGRIRILSGADGKVLRTFRREDYGGD